MSCDMKGEASLNYCAGIKVVLDSYTIKQTFDVRNKIVGKRFFFILSLL